MIKGACVSRAYSTDKNGNNIMHYWIRTEKGKFQINSYIDKPYFFANFKNKPYHEDIVEILDKPYKTQCGESVKKIYVKYPKSIKGYKKYDKNLKMTIDVPPIKENDNIVSTYEDYIEFADRCAADHGIKYGMWASSEYITHDNMLGGFDTEIMPTIAVLDSEVRTGLYNPRKKIEKKTVTFPSYELPINEILSIQILDYQTEYIYIFKLDNSDEIKYIKSNNQYKYDRKSKRKYFQPFNLDDEYRKKYATVIGHITQFTVYEHVFVNEKSMLTFVVEFLCKKRYDIVDAFYGMNFDFPYILCRMKFLKVDYKKLSELGYVTIRLKGSKSKSGDYAEENDIRIPGMNLIDTKILIVDKIFKKRSKNSLDAISYDYLGIGKIEHDDIIGEKGRKHSIDYEFYEQPDKFNEYAVMDVILDYCLQKILGIWRHYTILAKNSGTSIFQITSGRKRVRQTTLFYAKEMEYILERESFGSMHFKGARVDIPVMTGKIPKAADLDVTSQYPSLIEAYNISWDTIALDHKIFNGPEFKRIIDIQKLIDDNIPYCSHPTKGVYFRTDRIGLFPKIIRDRRSLRGDIQRKLFLLSNAKESLLETKNFDLLDDQYKSILIENKYNTELDIKTNLYTINYRQELYDNDQAVLKVDINLIYGNLPPFLAALVAAAGVKLIEYTRKIITKLGFPPNYTDTDSVIFSTRCKTVEKAKAVCEKIVDVINKSYKNFEKFYGCIENKLDIKSEEIYDPIVFKKTKTKKTAAAKTYIKCLVVDRGVVLTEKKLEHKGIIKPRQSSVFSVDIGKLLIFYIGMNYSNDIVIDRLLKLIKKYRNHSETSEIPEDEELEMKKKKLSLHKGIYSIDEICFPINIRMNWDQYKKLNYIQKGILLTNEWMHVWSPISIKFEKNDTAFMIFVKESSKAFNDTVIENGKEIENEMKVPRYNVWALNGDGKTHPDFDIDYEKHIEKDLSPYEELMRSVGIDPSVFLASKNQKSITNFFKKC